MTGEISGFTPGPWRLAPGVYDTNPETASEFPHGPELLGPNRQSIASFAMFAEKDADLCVAAPDMHAEIARLRRELAEAQGSSKLNGMMCDLGLASLDTWRDETLRLRREKAELVAALKPFAAYAVFIEGMPGGWYHDKSFFRGIAGYLYMKWFIDARVALRSTEKGEPT